MRDPPAAVVPDDAEPVETEVPHQRNLVGGHGPLGVLRIALRRCGLVAVAVTAQISQHNRVVVGQLRGDAVPDQVRLRIAVQQEQRRTVTRDGAVDAHLAGVDVVVGKAFRQRHAHANSSTALVNSTVFAVPPRSGVRTGDFARHAAMACSTSAAASA